MVRLVSGIQPRRRHDSAKPAPVPAEQRARSRELNQQRQSEIDSALLAWETYTLAKAEELSQWFDRKPRYFLDLFFQAGTRLASHHEKVNGFNAFKSMRIAEMREDGQTVQLMDVQAKLAEEWKALSEEDKLAVIEGFESSHQCVKRPTARSRIQDVSHVKRNMQALLSSLKIRVGIEGFFCIVRNNTEYNMAPSWFFTTPELEKYMDIAVRRRWDCAEIGGRLEAFAIAGCDVASMLFDLIYV
ncbi:hypothetical protein M378DRAFT_92015 [Amanita muscaria Koide BX008]|uniref:HMG box domain-containing protein n=1 Tax=Amanita muscaria (strain Koide BX008) TaxID=946122 RepID=A0A0C2W0T3_AMAMK|nr:hypothetical protein M378DRAFT_92499 [Amanita muscaria Koide BX008]KIL54722.1 hypothetical protein M378DRAFT_92015 [Amanita muscaria Koide BX008]